MTTEKSEYESVVEEKTRRLAKTINHRVDHGSEGFCPSCGHAGIYDLIGAGVSPSSIFYSLTDEKWRCMLCGLDKLGC